MINREVKEELKDLFPNIAILECIETNRQVTAREIQEYIENNKNSSAGRLSRSTIYRRLNKFIKYGSDFK